MNLDEENLRAGELELLLWGEVYIDMTTGEVLPRGEMRPPVFEGLAEQARAELAAAPDDLTVGYSPDGFIDPTPPKLYPEPSSRFDVDLWAAVQRASDLGPDGDGWEAYAARQQRWADTYFQAYCYRPEWLVITS